MSDEPSGELGEVEARGDTYLSPWDDPAYWYGANPYEDEAYQYSYNYEFDGTYDTLLRLRPSSWACSLTRVRKYHHPCVRRHFCP